VGSYCSELVFEFCFVFSALKIVKRKGAWRNPRMIFLKNCNSTISVMDM